MPALADDSGIEIDALDGAPGVYTADWAGPKRDFSIAMQRVHDELVKSLGWKGEPLRANFISVLCLGWPDGETELFEGKVYGHIVWPPRGTNGFGYDPIFVADGQTMTFGEMEPADKYAISHRTRAFDVFKRACLEDAGALTRPAFGVYVHWPFCAQKCPYCDFNSHVRFGGIDEPRFLAAYLRELDHAAGLSAGVTVQSIFFGGGTPSLMAPSTVAAILDHIAKLLVDRAERRDHARGQPRQRRGRPLSRLCWRRRQSRLARCAVAR